MRASSDRIRIGTRGSALALWQAEHVATLLKGLPGAPPTQLVLIKTEGDKIQDIPLWKVQGKAFFTKEIEAALLANEIDIAVHSLKDLATQMPDGLSLGAVLKREDPRDVLVFGPSLGLSDSVGDPGALSVTDPGPLPQGALVGTSSLRRRAFLARWRPDLRLAELRGNVPTRIGKLDDGGYDAIVLAAAGIIRLGMAQRISAFLPLDFFLPAVSQGAIGLQARSGDDRVSRWIEALDHRETRWATGAERALLRTLEGGCQVPVGAFGELNGHELILRGMICSLHGDRGVTGEVSGPPEEGDRLGVALAEELLRKGGGNILDEIRGGSGGV